MVSIKRKISIVASCHDKVCGAMPSTHRGENRHLASKFAYRMYYTGNAIRPEILFKPSMPRRHDIASMSVYMKVSQKRSDILPPTTSSSAGVPTVTGIRYVFRGNSCIFLDVRRTGCYNASVIRELPRSDVTEWVSKWM